MGGYKELRDSKIAAYSATEYYGNLILENGQISKILNEEGYIELGGLVNYYFYLKDHQGNNRVVCDQNGTICQVNNYYPFGMTFGEETDNSNNRYKYNGKELEHMHGLDWYDYGARNYDPAIGRWGTIDPLAEKCYSISPYAYCANNPIIFVDPDGRDWYQSENGKATIWRKGSGDIDGYTNIGTNFTQKINDNTSMTYTQNEATSMTTNTMTSGLMTPASIDPNRSSNVNKSDVKDVILYPLKGKINYDYDSNDDRIDTGRGAVINNTTYTNDQLKKGQVK